MKDRVRTPKLILDAIFRKDLGLLHVMKHNVLTELNKKTNTCNQPQLIGIQSSLWFGSKYIRIFQGEQVLNFLKITFPRKAFMEIVSIATNHSGIKLHKSDTNAGLVDFYLF